MDNLYLAVVHDIKNQLAELALQLERRGDCGRETSIALSAARRLTQMLLAQRGQRGQLQVDIDSHSPGDLLEELAGEYRILFPTLAIAVDAASIPDYWFYDAALLRLALGNALHNACRSAVGQVRLHASAEDDWLLLGVSDDGPGYPQAILDKQARHEPMRVSHNGTGLGLYLAAEIAGLHRNDGRAGRVDLANHDGATFLLRIP